MQVSLTYIDPYNSLSFGVVLQITSVGYVASRLIRQSVRPYVTLSTYPRQKFDVSFNPTYTDALH